jgi:hypothetical protein
MSGLLVPVAEATSLDVQLGSCTIFRAVLLGPRLRDSVTVHSESLWWGYRRCKAIDATTIEIRKHKEIVMAKVIEFYVPTKFKTPLKEATRWRRGKVIEFCAQIK